MTLPSLTLTSWILASGSALSIGLAKAGFGGFGLIAVLLMAQILPAKESTGAILPMLIAADLMAVGSFHRYVSWKDFWKLLPATVLGLFAGWILMNHIPAVNFGHFLGWLILFIMTLVVWQRIDRRFNSSVLTKILHYPTLTNATGLLAGMTTMMANAGGPVMTFYLMARELDKMAFVGTCAWFFFVTNLLKFPLSWNLGLITLKSLSFNLLLLPAVALGMILGKYFLKKIPQGPFDWLLVIMALASALRLICD